MNYDDLKRSHDVEKFLKFLDEAQIRYGAAIDKETEANREQQDIVHELELGDNSQMDYICLGIMAKQVRQKRRRSKNEQQCLRPIIDWIGDNAKSIRTLKQCLNSMRRAENEMNDRYYHPRTDVVKRALDWQQED